MIEAPDTEKQLSLYDVVNTPGVTADLSHIATGAATRGYLKPNDGLKKALDGVDVVIIPAGIPRKPGVSLIHFHTSSYVDSSVIDEQGRSLQGD